jgi:VWFA-related protein
MAEQAVREKARRLRNDFERASLDTLRTLNGLASGLAKIPGPKTIVFVSDGFVVDNVATTLQSVVGQVGRAGARVYAIDARGIRIAGADVDQMLADDPAGGPARFDMAADGSNSLAVDTGGIMIRNQNNIGRALEAVAADANRYYVLAYQPLNTAFDGKYRPIQVRVKRPGVVVRARRGYLALEPSKMLIPR